MSKVSLLTGGAKYSSLFSNNFRQNDGITVILSEAESEDSTGTLADEAREKKDDRIIKVVWNKRSPLSARNAVLSTRNRYGGVDKAVLIYQPGDYNKTFHETSSAVYDLQIDRWIKGYGYLLREIIQLFLKQQKGQLSFILDTDGMKIMTPLESAIFNYLKSLVKSLSVLYQNEPFRLYCFESDTSREDDFIDYFNKTVNEPKYTPGKLHRFGDRKNIFDFGRI